MTKALLYEQIATFCKDIPVTASPDFQKLHIHAKIVIVFPILAEVHFGGIKFNLQYSLRDSTVMFVDSSLVDPYELELLVLSIFKVHDLA